VVDLSLNVTLGVEALQLYSRIVGGESPGRSRTTLIAIGSPGSDCGIESRGRPKPALAEALPTEDAQLHFGHVQPRTVFRREDETQTATQVAGRSGVEGMTQTA
jgi:hypothetical protein